jgi:hypothetical protein
MTRDTESRVLLHEKKMKMRMKQCRASSSSNAKSGNLVEYYYTAKDEKATDNAVPRKVREMLCWENWFNT